MQGFWPAVLVALTISACAVPESIKQTEQAHYHIVSELEIRMGMQRMAGRIRAIANVSLDRDMPLEQQRNLVLPLLDDIESTAADLDNDQAVTNYSVINRYMGAFLYDVSVARQFATRDPPNLLPAQRLIKSCLSCHDSI